MLRPHMEALGICHDNAPPCKSRPLSIYPSCPPVLISSVIRPPAESYKCSRLPSLMNLKYFPYESKYPMEWSPQHAMNAYLHTLHLSKVEGGNFGLSTGMIEPQCTELVSALAAGRRAKLMVEVTTEGITPLTLALAEAAKQTGGQLICILAVNSNNELQSKQIGEESRRFLRRRDLEDAVKFVHCEIGNVCEVTAKVKNVDFAVVDCKFDECLQLFQSIDVNPIGCSVVVHNLYSRKYGVSFAEVVKRRKGVEPVTLPIGEGIELTRIGSSSINTCKGRHRRFHVTFEN